MAAWVGAWMRDLAIALRGMRRSPAFTVVAVATLALGIGGASAIYTLLERVVLDPLPYPQPGRLVRLDNQVPGVGPHEVWSLSKAQWVYFTEHASTLSQVGLYRGTGDNMMTPSGPRRVMGVAATASMMPLLGARASLGRVIAPSDDTPTSPRVVLLSHGFWERVLGGDAGVVGRTMDLNGQPVEVIGVLDRGVLPPGWPPTEAPDVWVPMRVDRGGPFYNSHVFPAIAQLAPGATPAAAEAEIGRLTQRLPEAFPRVYWKGFFSRYGFHTRVRPLKESILGDLSTRLWIVFGGVGLVLLIACANVANLFVVRMETRRREMAIRSALGAGRRALARYVLAEGMTLALAGAAVALALGFWAVPALTALAPGDLARLSGIGMDSSTVLFALIVAVAVGLALAAYPILVHAGAKAGELAGGGRGSSSGPGQHRVRSALVMAQVALALTLVVGSGLLVRTLATLHRTHLGFDPDRVLAVNLYPSPERYQDLAALRTLEAEILRRVRALPGVRVAGFGSDVPVSGSYGCTIQAFEDASVYTRIKEAGLTTCAGQEHVTPGYFRALGIPSLEGRLPTEADLEPRSRSVIVSKAFADRFWPGQEALGQGVNPSGKAGPPFYHVVGVVGDVPASSSEGQPPLSRTAVAIYYPGAAGQTLVVRAAIAAPTSLVPAIRRAVADVDPQMPLADMVAMTTVVGDATAQLSFVSLLLAIAAAIALLLAAVGLYGVISYLVARRTREIGMRMAIGAQPAQVQRMVVGESVAVVAAGLVVGVVLALLATRVLDSLLVGVAHTDPPVYVAAAGVLIAVTLVASWLPARRASRIDPMEALRTD